MQQQINACGHTGAGEPIAILDIEAVLKYARFGGDRAQVLVQNLRRAREDIWAIATRVFTEEQLNELDLLISSWWYRAGGTEFVAYVRFTDVAAQRGADLISEVKSGGGLLEPLDRATEQVAQANMALQRSFFWAKRKAPRQFIPSRVAGSDHFEGCDASTTCSLHHQREG